MTRRKRPEYSVCAGKDDKKDERAIFRLSSPYKEIPLHVLRGAGEYYIENRSAG